MDIIKIQCVEFSNNKNIKDNLQVLNFIIKKFANKKNLLVYDLKKVNSVEAPMSTLSYCEG